MHRSTIFALLGFALSGSVVAQKNEQAYCDFEKAPWMSDCFNIKDKGIKDSSWYSKDAWTNGNCRVSVDHGSIRGGKGSIEGQWLKRIVQDILDNCDSGFKYHKGVRVDVVLCKVAAYGREYECRGPLVKVEGGPLNKRAIDAVDAVKRHHFTDVSSMSAHKPDSLLRRQYPWPGLVCGGGPGTSTIKDCRDALDKLKGMKTSIKLPYKTTNDGCVIHIYPTNRKFPETTDLSIPRQIEIDLDACADKTKNYIGMVHNYRGNGYHWFAGAFCGAFNTGKPGYCWPGGK